MKKVRLVSISLRNFKGVHSFSATFGEHDTRIHGQNGSGKTTIFDAFSYLLYGKDSVGRADFNIKTLTSENKPVHNLEHEVAGVFEVTEDGKVYHHDLRRIYKEKWQKKRGADEPEMTGHETLFFYNDVPLSASEYKTKVDNIISEEVSRLITNPLFFNVNMKWQDRRTILSKMAGDVSNDDILDAIADCNVNNQLIELLRSDKTLAEHKREFASKRKKMTDELETIPARIDEVKRSKPEPIVWASLESKLKHTSTRIDAIDKEIGDKQTAQNNFFETIREAKANKFAKETELKTLRSTLDRDFTAAGEAIRTEIQTLEGDQRIQIQQREHINREIGSISTTVTNLENDASRKRLEWTEWNEKEWNLDPSKCECPTCKRPLEGSEVAKLQADGKSEFDQRKTTTMESIQSYGKQLKADIEANNDRIEALKVKLKEVDDAERLIIQKLKEKKAALMEMPDVSKRPIALEETALEEAINAIVIPETQNEDFTEQTDEKKRLLVEIDDIKKDLAKRDTIEAADKRIQELKEQQKTISQEIATLERMEMSIDKFNRVRIETIESRINGLFDKINVGTLDAPEWEDVKFKMFEQQVNGGESEICECLVNGVPYSDINTAKKLNAGISVINALCRFYGITAPIFVDGRESVTLIINTPAQLISLVVDPSFDKLTLVA